MKTAAPASPYRTRRWRCSRFTGWTTWGDQPGAGLGLALVKDITAYHGTRPELLSSAALGGLLVRVRFTLLP
ncbi:Uncharacterised protein [Serratia marcescens]|uniref:Histidine kinase n=1 Tax=Serratia marcescens TaxID=615 RepID=A0A379YZT8_SERMA|nr:Uncharacterised protein [Serratia marcescens]